MPTTTSFTTNGGLTVDRTESIVALSTALDPIFNKIDTHAGVILSSGFDYPGRHSRWEIGFVNPAVEFVAKKQNFFLRALNLQGRAVLSLLATILLDNDHLTDLDITAELISGKIATPPAHIPEELRSKQPSIFSVLRSLLNHFRSNEEAADLFGLYGAFGYDLIFQFEQIQQRIERDDSFSDCHLFLPLELIVIDRKKEIATSVQYSFDTPLGSTKDFAGGGQSYPANIGQGSEEIVCDNEPGEFAAKVAQVIEGTKRGDYFEVVLSQSFSTRVDEAPTTLFKRLAKLNPSPYMFLINLGDEQLVGSSPEIYVRISGTRYETCPISGTVRRGKDALEDADRVKELITSEKDETELTMCTDVDRNDMARVCVPGSVKIIGRRQLEFYSHLIHTVDHVEGTLAEGYDCLDAFQTHMWACTVTGSPKPAAIQEIENFEKSRRGWYSGAVGLLSFQGNINTGITLRTAHIKNGRATINAGATLIHDSIPEDEEQETRTKAAAFLATLTLGRQDNTVNATAAAASTTLHGKKVLLVDCRDSFVHNLASYVRELGPEVVTMRVGFPLELIDSIKPDLVFFSPGPGTPESFGLHAVLEAVVSRNIPIFGVCLGHQAIGQYFGATLKQLPAPRHGKPSLITHRQSGLFAGIAPNVEVGRYHSLYLDAASVPTTLEVIAETTDHFDNAPSIVVPMAFAHKTLPIASVQFHPESLMTMKGNAGQCLLRNALTQLIAPTTQN